MFCGESSANLFDVTVTETLPDGWGNYGMGIAATDGAVLSVFRAAVSKSHAAGAVACENFTRSEAGKTVLVAKDLVVRETKKQVIDDSFGDVRDSAKHHRNARPGFAQELALERCD